MIRRPDDPPAGHAMDASQAEPEAFDEAPQVSWATRAGQVSARPLDDAEGRALFTTVWRGARHAVRLDDDELARFAAAFTYVRVAPEKDVIVQAEAGDYLLVLLDGKVSVDLVHGAGERTRLALAQACDLIGEMALVDAGVRFSTCTTRTVCVLAVLETARLRELVQHDPRLALALYASLSRRLSLRLRQLGTRLSALLASH